MILTEPETADIIPAFVFRDLLRRKVSVIIYDRLDCSYFMEKALRSMGVTWIQRVDNYRVSNLVKVLRDARTTKEKGLKVILADGECQLARQRRVRPANARAVAEGKRVVRTRFWVDPDVCTGDHSCIRLSGCPSLSVKSLDDPLRDDPVAHIDQSCVGCGNCGEVADAAVLCPSFYRADVVHNPGRWDRFLESARRAVIGFLQRRQDYTKYFSRAPVDVQHSPRAHYLLASQCEGGAQPRIIKTAES